jgi:hypothetical protein
MKKHNSNKQITTNKGEQKETFAFYIGIDLGFLTQADQFIFGVAPTDYSPALLLMPFGFHLTMDTLPSGNCRAAAPGPPWSVSSFRLRARLGLSIPSTLPDQRGITPAFGYGAPHSGARGT